MIKLIVLIVCAYVALLLIPGTLAVLAGMVLFGAVVALFFSGIGSLISFFGSTALSILGGIFTGIVTLGAVAILAVSFPLLLVVLIPFGLMLLMGGLFCTVVCGI
jgi:hypothetical protein